MGKLNTALSLKVAKEDAAEDELLDQDTTAEDDVVEDEAGQTDDVTDSEDDASTDDDAGEEEGDTDEDEADEGDTSDEDTSDEDATDEDDVPADDDVVDDTVEDDTSDEDTSEDEGTDDDAEPEATDEEIYESAGDDGAKLDAISKQLLELNTNADATDEEVTDTTDEQELVEEVTESLESHYDSIVASIESGGLTAREAAYAQQVTNLHLQRAGVDSVPNISVESFGASGARIVNTQVLAQGLEGRIGDLVKKMLEGLKKVAAKVADWFKTAMTTRNGLKSEAQKLLDKLPENFDAKVKVDGARLNLFVHDGKVVSDLAAAIGAQFKLGEEINRDNSILTWVTAIGDSGKELMNGDYGSLKLNQPSYLKESSTDSRYSKYLDAGYEVKVVKAPLGNFEVFGALVPSGTEITAENAMFHAGQRFNISDLESAKVDEQEVNLGNVKRVLEDVVKFYDESNALKEMSLGRIFTEYEKVSDENASYLKAVRLSATAGKNMFMPHMPFFGKTRKIVSMYMRLVNEAIGETAKDESGAAASDDAATA